MKNKKKYSEIIKEIARREGVSVEHINEEIERAITVGFMNPDPEVRKYWAKIAPDGKIPSPEKAIEILTKMSKMKMKM